MDQAILIAHLLGNRNGLRGASLLIRAIDFAWISLEKAGFDDMTAVVKSKTAFKLPS
jgi:hypothetical protein